MILQSPDGLAQENNNNEGPSVAFFEPPVQADYSYPGPVLSPDSNIKGLLKDLPNLPQPVFSLKSCGLRQSADQTDPNYIPTIWQCHFIDDKAGDALGDSDWMTKELSERVWIVPIDNRGNFGEGRLFNTFIPSIQPSLKRPVLGINEQGQWLLSQPAVSKLPTNLQSTLLVVDWRPFNAEMKDGFTHYTSYSWRLPLHPDYQVMPFPKTAAEQGWLILDRWQNDRQRNISEIIKIQPNKTTDGYRDKIDWKISSEELRSDGSHAIDIKGSFIYPDGHVLIWGDDKITDTINGAHNEPFMICIWNGVQAAKARLDFSADEIRAAVSLSPNEVLLLQAEQFGDTAIVSDGESFVLKKIKPESKIKGWVVSKNCQVRLWGEIKLENHFTEDPAKSFAQESYSWLEQAVKMENGDIVAFYTQQRSLYSRFDRRMPDPYWRTALRAVRFNPMSQKIIWDRVVISNLDETSAVLSASPHFDQTITLSYLSQINQIWISPQIRTKVEEAASEKQDGLKPRIYRLPLD